MIDAYIGELEHRLRGPRRVKADLLAEARDALLDAASAYERGGLAPQAAEARAVDDFGAVDEIGPEYQAELAFSQGRAAALALFFALAVAVSLTALGLVLGWTAPRAGSLLSLSVGLPWAFAFLLVPMASVAVLGRRCLAAAP